MSQILRYEILVDHVYHQKVAGILREIGSLEYSAHRANSAKMYESVVTKEDISDAIAHDYFVVFLSEEKREKFEKAIKKLIKMHSASVYVSTVAHIE